MKKILFFFICLFILSTENTFCQKKNLTYNQVYNFAEPRLTKPLPLLKGWLDDNYFLEVKTDSSKSIFQPVLMKVSVKDGSSEVFIDYQKINKNLPNGFSIEKAINSFDYKGFLFNERRDLYYYSLNKNQFIQLTNDTLEEKNPKFSPDNKKIAYTKNNNLFVYDLDKQKETQLTFDGSNLIYNGWASWVYYEEILGRSSNYAAFWWSPKSNKICFLRFDDSPVPEFPLYRADGQHGSLEIQRYPKAGDPNPKVKLGILDLATEKIVWADFDENLDQYIAWPFWTNDGNQLTIQWMNRDQNNIKIYFVDTSTGKLKELYNEVQRTWVEWFEDLYFLKNNKGFILRTSVDGWYRLYFYDMNGNLKKKLTDGNLNALDIAYVDEQKEKVYFHGWKDNSTERHLFVVNLDGKGLKQITLTEGTHNCTISPGGKYFYDRYSNILTPPRIDLYSINGKKIRVIGDSKILLMNEYNLTKPELFSIPTEDGYKLPAVWYLPPNFDQSKKYPVIISIYGGPGYPTVRNSFPYWLEPYYLAQNGIIYFSVDHRGSGHFGKKGIDLMYRNLGKWEMHDYIEAVKWLKKKSFIDSNKIAITGGSYGGYITALALTYGADYFKYGIAEFGVMDWKLYDNVYTERYMDKPEENEEGYKNSSVLNYVKNYKGKLLIIHGTMDDNVHMQNSIQLIYELQKLNKDFELMIYPNARHGITAPLRNHSNKLKVQFWFKYLLGKELDIERN
ncbi:MAG: S9 family peptidase [Melioribacter sp.]|nr:S9 family peptidase [Melioribacter sp.]